MAAALTAALLFLAVSSNLYNSSTADTPQECPYPCLPPPTSGATLPPPPPSEAALPYLQPPPQPYTPGWVTPPSGSGSGSGYLPGYQQPPAFSYPPPPPPNPIMPYFPYYFRKAPNAASQLKGGVLWTAMALSSSILVHFFLY